MTPIPDFEEILDPAGTLLGNATAFAITNNTGGSFDNYIFRLTGTGFTYNGSGVPTAGTITGGLILDPSGATTIATITGISAPLAGFYNALVGPASSVLGALGRQACWTPTPMPSTARTGADHPPGVRPGTGDTLTAGSGSDLLWHVAGEDHIMIGGTGNDTFRLDKDNASTAQIHGSAQNGTGGAGETDIIEVSALNAIVGTVTNVDRVNFVGAGTTTVTFSASNVGNGLPGNLVVQGSVGFSALQLVRGSASALNVNLANWQFINFADDQIVIDLTTGDDGNDTVVGSSVRDLISSGSGNDALSGASGNDTIDGGDGADTLNGGAGNDSLLGGVGNDAIIGGIGVDLMSGEAGNDLFIYEASAAVAGEAADGGIGIDTIRATGSNNFQASSFSGVERFQFAAAATLTFNASLLHGDFTFFGDGNINKISILRARATTLSMEGFIFSSWATTDIVTLTGSAAGDTVTGSAVADIVNGNGGRDLISGEIGNDILNGGASIDILTGGAGNDAIDGGTEADIIDAGLGDDNVKGGFGNDNLDGGAGNDILNSGAGYDVLAGGTGNDIFLFNAALAGNRDQISDFNVAADTIQLENAIFTLVGAPGVLESRAFRIGSAADDAFDRIIYDRTTGDVFYDRDGNGASVQVKFAELDSALALTRADFVVV